MGHDLMRAFAEYFEIFITPIYWKFLKLISSSYSFSAHLQDEPKPTGDVFNNCTIPYPKREFLSDDDQDQEKSSAACTSSKTNAAHSNLAQQQQRQQVNTVPPPPLSPRPRQECHLAPLDKNVQPSANSFQNVTA